MPHLSPMNWIAFSFLFWMFIISISTILWWSPKISSSIPLSTGNEGAINLPWYKNNDNPIPFPFSWI